MAGIRPRERPPRGSDAWTGAPRVNEWVNNPLVWIGMLSVAAVVVGTIFGIGQWKGRLDADRSTLRKDIDSDRGTIRDFMTEIRADIKRIFERLPMASTVAGASPLRLTELGEKISVQLAAGAIADGLAPRLRERVAGMQAYDIQELCFAYIRDEYEPPDDVKTLILQCAFDNGIDREQVLRVIAIELRDQLLPPTDSSPPSEE